VPSGIYEHRPCKETTKGKISQSLKGNTNSKGRIFHHTIESKTKISLAQLGKKRGSYSKSRPDVSERNRMKVGDLSPNWKGGLCKDRREYARFKSNERLARKKQALGSHTFGDWETLKAQYDYTCPCCGRQEPKISLTEDHVIPLSRGGSNNIENIQPLCLSCNCHKYTKTTKFPKVKNIETEE
jgi:5-methylcytosine-specific restriction endonuclease McrA